MANPTTAMSMIAEEIRQQANTVLQDATEVSPVIDAISENLALAEPVSQRALLTHAGLRVSYNERTREQADNEGDLVAYSYDVDIWTSDGDDHSDAGEALEAWTARVAEILGDAASSRSPLRTVPLPLSSLTPPNVVVYDVQIGTDVPGTFEVVAENMFKPGRTLPITVTVYQNRSRP